jgi:spermidine synthase
VTRQAFRVAGLLFFSGLCALVYQTVWLRQFRLIFGASTFATGAVLAIFMGGLGAGSALLGRRADARERPLLFYGNLELLISIAAAISPLLLDLAARLYFASGGSPNLGIAGATLLRLVLATLVLGPATLLMGGTLPAAARAVATTEDAGRHSVALLYGVNTLGAVAGALLSTFVLLETFGNRTTLIVAVLINVLVAMVARSMGRTSTPGNPATEQPCNPEPPHPRNPATYVYAASAIVGFAFLLMELVWYRMLSPILGGTTYMFGLILAVALLGIGAGGALYAGVRGARATAGSFALTCGLEALALAVPFALGDRLALLANALRDLGAAGFSGHVTGWTLVTFIVVFPAACVAGYQFPLLIALLGRGSENVGRQIGAAYAWNTAGAIAGSLAGGFGLLPLLSAPGTWRLVALVLIALAAAAVVLAFREGDVNRAFATIAVGIVALACAFSAGPTAVWRHSGIGAARAPRPKTRNELRDWMNTSRRAVVWEKDGRESSVAAIATADFAFHVNGKSDGAARYDAETQVMSGLLGAALHPNPKTSLVIGLGTGSTSGWLGQVRSMQRVDTIELEPVVLDVARACAAVNANAMKNPKVRVTIADAREVLLASDATYDLIASEPSNPYRAGIASLFTREFYQAAERRLAPRGHLMQWVQAYAVHTSTMKTIYATLTSVFPHVQTWWTSRGDLLLIASREPIVVDAATLRARIATEPYRTALHAVWRADTLEHFLGHLVANETFARAAAKDAAEINTDDRTVIEFGFARSIDASAMLMGQIASEAERLELDRPVAMRGAIDWNEVDANRLQRIAKATRPMNLAQLSQWTLARIETGDLNVQQQIDIIGAHQPVEADVITASLLRKQGRLDEAAAVMHRALVAFRTYPWSDTEVMAQAMTIAGRIGETSPARARLMFDALSKPFSVLQQQHMRRYALLRLAPLFDGCGATTLAALRAVEPHPYWNREILELRADCYRRAGLDALADQAWSDLAEYAAGAPTPVVTPPASPAPRGSS